MDQNEKPLSPKVVFIGVGVTAALFAATTQIPNVNKWATERRQLATNIAATSQHTCKNAEPVDTEFLYKLSSDNLKILNWKQPVLCVSNGVSSNASDAASSAAELTNADGKALATINRQSSCEDTLVSGILQTPAYFTPERPAIRIESYIVAGSTKNRHCAWRVTN